MSNDGEQHEAPPDFGHDDDDDGGSAKVSDSMYVSAMPPTTTDIQLNDEDDDENPFGDPVEKEEAPTNTANTAEVSEKNEPNSSDLTTEKAEVHEEATLAEVKFTSPTSEPIHNAPESSANVPTDLLPVTPPSTPLRQESTLHTTEPLVISTPTIETNAFFEHKERTTKTNFTEVPTEDKPIQKRPRRHDIEITVSDPTKVGDGMSSYMSYRVTTKTSMPTFKSSEFTVPRRFSDFLGLHVKLVHKYLHIGYIIPSPPEKDSLSMAKVKISKDDNIPTDFIDRRRALLERYLNRLVQHGKLIEDADLREFIEMPNELPKATNTQALSGAGVLRALTNISQQVTKIATKKSEQDEWFEEKHVFVNDLHKYLKNLTTQFNAVFAQRKEAINALKHFSFSLNHLATTEEHPLLSSALIELAEVQEKLEQVDSDHALKEYSTLTELIKEYVSLLDMVELSFQARVKVHQQWLNAEDTLRKKRETKVKLEASPKGADKIPQAEMEIVDWEGKAARCKEDFENMSATIKQEIDLFEQIRFDDFREAIQTYLRDLLEEKKKILQIWEKFLPEANKIVV